MTRPTLIGLAALAVIAASAPARAEPDQAPFAYQLEEGRILNAFFRDGPVAAHLLLRSGRDPRIIVAFPAGNSGTGLWFEPLAADARWRIDAAPAALTGQDRQGRALHGITVSISIDAPQLTIKGAALSSVRVLRDYELSGQQPAEVTATPIITPRSVTWQRDRLDGAPGYRLTLDLLSGRIEGNHLIAGADGRIAVKLTAQTGEQPLTPLGGSQLLNERAAADGEARRTLEFLSYREKFLAGSWRFNTYFGRDTLMTVRLLMPALRPQAVEAGIGAVLARLSPEGEVAHEEDIGEYAVIDHLRHDGTRSAQPVYDYKMIDGTPMLAAIAGRWLLDDPRARLRAAAFLAQDTTAGRSNGAALAANLQRVVMLGARFSANPRPANLVALRPGINVGNWRDSEDGLGGGRYPYDVNAVLMPAALLTAARLEASGLLDPWLDKAAHARLRGAAAMARVWEAKAPGLFHCAVSHTDAAMAVARAAGNAGIDPAPALAAIGGKPLRFPALALDASGRPVPVANSDIGFALLFASPAASQLEDMAALIARPFPAGLMTAAGMLTANPAFAPADLQSRFSPAAYHGMVVWSWQQALALAGLDRQLARGDLPARTRAALTAARRALAGAIAANRQWRNSELWSWQAEGGTITPKAFGASSADADESNAAQLWSSALLGIARDAPAKPER
ncbi:MAG: hypothetical protein JSR96_04150 [Proteobacteria bacterium]|nr:hypothetical protein [Pseudomonadota bacterium]